MDNRFINHLYKVIKNNENLIKNIIASGGIRGIAIIISLVTTPSYMRYFDDSAVLGVWLTIISILTTVGVLDFGLGNGLRNKLTAAFAERNELTIKKLISSSYFIIVVISASFVIIGILVANIINWNRILGIDASIIGNAVLQKCCIIVIIGVMCQMILKVITSILYAEQKAALVSFLPLITNASMLLFVLLTKGTTSEQNLITLSWVYLIAANLPYICLTLVLFRGVLKDYRPKKEYVEVVTVKNILKLGIVFFYLQLMSIAVHNTNEILISALFDSSMVVEYQVYNKIFYLITTGLNVIMIPLWSAVTKALYEKNYAWLNKIHKILCASSGLALVLGFIITIFMQFIVNAWLGNQAIEINKLYCIPFVIYVAEEAFNGANATLANGSNWLKIQIIFAPISAFMNIPLTFLFRELFGNWLAIQVANIFSLFPIAIAQFIYIRKKLAKAELEYRTEAC